MDVYTIAYAIQISIFAEKLRKKDHMSGHPLFNVNLS